MKKAFVILTVLFLFNIPNIYYGWYLRWVWIDIPQHFSGGFFIAMLMAAYLRDYIKVGGFIKNIIIVIGTTALVGVLWEFAEYIANQTLIDPLYNWFGIKAYFMGDLNDTIADLFLDILGALTFSLLFLRKPRNY